MNKDNRKHFILETFNSVKGAGPWRARHLEAWNNPGGFEFPVVRMLEGLSEYLECHQVRFHSSLANDGVLGEAWLDALRAVRAMLNGELGRLDGGSLDTLICALYKRAGFEGEL